MQGILITSENILDLFNSQIFVAIDIKTIERGSEHCIVLLSLRSYHGSLELIIRDASIEIGIKLSENALHLLNSHLVFEDLFSDCLKGETIIVLIIVVGLVLLIDKFAVHLSTLRKFLLVLLGGRYESNHDGLHDACLS